LADQKIAIAIREIYREEVGSAWLPDSSVVCHCDVVMEMAYARKAFYPMKA
jgi:hypothetical protein